MQNKWTICFIYYTMNHFHSQNCYFYRQNNEILSQTFPPGLRVSATCKFYEWNWYEYHYNNWIFLRSMNAFWTCMIILGTYSYLSFELTTALLCCLYHLMLLHSLDFPFYMQAYIRIKLKREREEYCHYLLSDWPRTNVSLSRPAPPFPDLYQPIIIHQWIDMKLRN